MTTDPKIEIVDVTPELAESWLETNTHNRDLRERYVQRLAESMTRGEWQLDGNSIKFSAEGVLLDGQHRLFACILADTSFRTVVVWGVDPTAMDTLDTGRARTLGDVLKLHGEANHTVLASTLSMLWRWESDLLNTHLTPTPPEALHRLAEDPEGLREAVRYSKTVRTRIRPVSVPSGIVAACIYRFTQVDRDDAHAFFEKLATGADLAVDDPIFNLRRWLQNQTNRQGSANTYVMHALFIKAWNYWRSGRKTQYLTYRPGGATPEPFPRIEW